MIKIYFAPNWGISSSEMLNYFKRQTYKNDGIWENIIAVSSQFDADYIIVQDGSTEKIENINKVIFFGREPKHVKLYDWSDKNCYKFYHHEFGTCWLPVTWWVDLSYDKLKKNVFNKSKKFSIIDSGKSSLQGHQNRLNLINNYLLKYKNSADLYGWINDKPLPPRDKSLGLIDYKYTLAIENGSTDFYFSEKITDSIICETMPIYWGCKKIDKFLPKGSYYQIDIYDNVVIDKIYEVINSDYREQNLKSLIEAKELILDKYNIWPTIRSSISDNKNNLI
jgi:hypothetical protein